MQLVMFIDIPILHQSSGFKQISLGHPTHGKFEPPWQNKPEALKNLVLYERLIIIRVGPPLANLMLQQPEKRPFELKAGWGQTRCYGEGSILGVFQHVLLVAQKKSLEEMAIHDSCPSFW